MSGSQSQVVLITGSSSGLGRTTAERLARAGYTVWAGMRDPAGRNAAAAGELAAMASAGGHTLHPVDIDVCSTASVDAAVARVLEAEGRIDVLFNNAGIMYAGLTESYSVEQLQEQLETNVVGAFRLVKAVLPSMREHHSGLLIHTSSVYGRLSSPFCGLYHASKFAIEGMMQSLAYEVHLLGIDSVLLEPGPFRTPLLARGAVPRDAAVLGGYGPVAKAFEAWAGGFGAFMAQPLPQLEPERVAEAVQQLIETKAGERPQRLVVGLSYGCDAYNDAVAPIERGMLDGSQLGFLIGPR